MMEGNVLDLSVEPGKLGTMIVILSLSLSAVSFPAISKQVPVIRIPYAVFFMGKHFGTGVILSTAFCHLLQDAFGSLQNPLVKEYYHKVGKWTGLIILSSLLTIFLVEYISTTYVDYLHADPIVTYGLVETPKLRSESLGRNQSPAQVYPSEEPLSRGALLLIPETIQSPVAHQHSHHNHHSRETETLPVELITSSRRHIKCCLISSNCKCGSLPEEDRTLYYDVQPISTRNGQKDAPRSKSGRRQLVGILVLQLGIMMHSLVIGLTLSLARGSEFASLFVAICFHQVFEGLSLGIRIDALPPFSLSSLLSTPHSPSQLSISSESTRLLAECSPPPRLYTPTRCASQASSLDHRNRSCLHSRHKPMCSNINWMKTILSILFGITTPFGMLLGSVVFPHSGHNSKPDEKALMLLTQGVMSAISAGMLIYAATVEMMAGDFVFGDVSGGHSHHPGAHAHERMDDLERTNTEIHAEHVSEGLRDHELPVEFSENDFQDYAIPDGHKPSTVGRKTLAIASLLGGVAVMNTTAIFE